MDFRECVAASRDTRDTLLVRDPVACTEIPARVAGIERGGNQALLFETVVGRQARVVGNLLGAPGRVCRALGVRSYPRLFERLEAAIERPAPLRTGSRWDRAYQCFPSPDLGRLLPVIRYSEGDATPYLTSGILMARYPGSARRHICFVRMAVAGENRLVINPGTPRIRAIVDETVGRGEALDVLILIGAPMELILLACVTMPDGQDKLEVAQALAGGTLSFSDDALPVPHSTEYVLRARVIPRFEKEGPFGEVSGMYSVKERNPTCLVQTLWRRPNPIYHSVSAGTSREHLELVSLGPRSFLERLKRLHSGILRYHLPAYGNDRLAVVSVRHGFDPRRLAPRWWDVPLVRGFIFVNEDVNPRSAAGALWAVLHRACNADHFAFSDARHAVYRTDKFMIDATVPDPAAWESRRVKVFDPRA